MLVIKEVQSLGQLAALKKHYFSLATAPLDGMWHFGFVPMASHFAFYENELLVGYCCINAEGYMLQFYLSPNAQTEAATLFASITVQVNEVIGKVNGAFVSTAEKEYLAHCLDNGSSFVVNALMYQQQRMTDEASPLLALSLATQAQLAEFVQFAVRNIAAPEQWLSGYFANLIDRQELFGYWEDGQLVASGECRIPDEQQTQYADLGMIVAQPLRGQGIATKVLQSLSANALKRGLQPICSTESGNIGAQKAISRAGFNTRDRIIQLQF